MTIEDLEKKILETKAELEKSIIELSNLKKSENKPPERWEPAIGQDYKTILSDGSIETQQHVNDHIDHYSIKLGNTFPLDMPLNDVVMMHQFINEIESICWQLKISKNFTSHQCVIFFIKKKISDYNEIRYNFLTEELRDKAQSMLSNKVKEWLKV